MVNIKGVSSVRFPRGGSGQLVSPCDQVAISQHRVLGTQDGDVHFRLGCACMIDG
jgi:hypothetical protein